MLKKHKGEYRVLLAESDPVMENHIRTALEKTGFSVVSVSSSNEAIATARTQKPDVMVLDSEPPLMDCERVCKHLSGEEFSKGMPIIVLSAVSDPAQKILAFQFGAKRFIHKPFDLRELVEEVKKSIEQVERTRQIHEYRDKCDGDIKGDFSAVPSDFKDQIDTCDENGKE